jgi:thiamine pyrophosphate-dependent acetolactate synthase large subunit-like protein
MAMDQPRGPVYISLPRDVIAEALTAVTINTPARREVANQRHPDPARLQEAAKILAESKSPLIITSELGRSALAVAGLVELADAGAIEVIEASPVYANFPADHPCHAGYVFGSAIHPAIAKADALLVIDCDVPWFPARVKIRDKAQVIHLAVDPFFNRYPMHNFRCDVPLAAEPEVTLPLLADAVRKRVKKREVRRSPNGTRQHAENGIRRPSPKPSGYRSAFNGHPAASMNCSDPTLLSSTNTHWTRALPRRRDRALISALRTPAASVGGSEQL